MSPEAVVKNNPCTNGSALPRERKTASFVPPNAKETGFRGRGEHILPRTHVFAKDWTTPPSKLQALAFSATARHHMIPAAAQLHSLEHSTNRRYQSGHYMAEKRSATVWRRDMPPSVRSHGPCSAFRPRSWEGSLLLSLRASRETAAAALQDSFAQPRSLAQTFPAPSALTTI